MEKFTSFSNYDSIFINTILQLPKSYKTYPKTYFKNNTYLGTYVDGRDICFHKKRLPEVAQLALNWEQEGKKWYINYEDKIDLLNKLSNYMTEEQQIILSNTAIKDVVPTINDDMKAIYTKKLYALSTALFDCFEDITWEQYDKLTSHLTLDLGMYIDDIHALFNTLYRNYMIHKKEDDIDG